MKERKSKGNLHVIRQNIRKLSEFLELAIAQAAKFQYFMDILKPSNFPLILTGVEQIPEYYAETDQSESPTLAINFGTLRKNVVTCHI